MDTTVDQLKERDVFTTNFWTNKEVCMITKIEDDGLISFIRFEAFRSRKTMAKDCAVASVTPELAAKIRCTLTHHSEWYHPSAV